MDHEPRSRCGGRHKLPALAEAGFHAVAGDMHGYGQTGGPAGIEAYMFFRLVGDVVGLLDALGAESAVIASHLTSSFKES